jgi:farnesyl diphosphate synthase
MQDMTETAFAQWMHAIAQQTETALDALLPPEERAPHVLHKAMRYAVLGGGKRVRPLLVHGAGQLVCAAPELLDRLACAIELIHAYSLVHDDMPCMDDDVLRRGKPTVHVAFGEAMALLVGDALQSLAFEQLAAPMPIGPSRQCRLLHQVARASGSHGMAGGQAMDLSVAGQAITLETLEWMHIHKTGALIQACVVCGAQCGEDLNEGRQEALARYAHRVGLLFQVVDDLLDAKADTATLGKTAGKDAIANKPTYVSLLGTKASEALAQRLLGEALACLDPWDERADPLRELARFVVRRHF